MIVINFGGQILNELTKRILVAVICIPLSALVIWYGGILFVFVLSAISSIALAELFKLAKSKNIEAYLWLSIALTFIFHLLIYFVLRNDIPLIAIGLISIFSLFIITIGIIQLFSTRANAFLNVITSVGGVVYVNILFLPLLILREFYYIIKNTTPDIINSNAFFVLYDYQDWAIFLFGVLSAIWICDSAAYFIGKVIGKHKLYEKISPKKTWEGTIAGIILGIIYFGAFVNIAFGNIPLLDIIIIGFIITIFAQLGDLAESQIKRDIGIKDSSKLIPGHGGMLDRFDSPMYVFPLIVVYLTIILIMS